MNVPFNIPYVIGSEVEAIASAIQTHRFCGGGQFGAQCENLLDKMFPGGHALVTTSCTDALEICADLLAIEPGDEVIAPSFTFVSTVNPFVMRGAKIRYVDISYPSMNVTPETFEAAITPSTRVIVCVNYGGGSEDLVGIREMCDRHKLILVEDAAQSILSYCKGKAIGTFGHLACISFHETKNIHCGEGGALIINDPKYLERAEIIREKGTNRSQFFRGQIDKYTWVDIGSSHIPAELNSAFLSQQLINAAEITEKRKSHWELYRELCDQSSIDYVRFKAEVDHNGHIFGILTKSIEKRQEAISVLKENGIHATFHYVPLHSSPMGRQSGVFNGKDIHTTDLSNRLLRVPLYPDLKPEQIEKCVMLLRNLGCGKDVSGT